MPTIIVQGRQVPVSDDYFRLSPQEQEATVKQIADRMAWKAITGMPQTGLGQPSVSASEAQQPDHSWSELRGNIVPSAVNTVTGLWDMVTHPQRTAETLVDAAQGGVDRIVPEEFTDFMDTYVSPRSPETRERQRQVSGAVGQALYDRYGTLQNIKNTMITDPVGSALDVAGIATGAVGLARGGLSIGSSANLAKTPGAALNAERLAPKELGPMIAENSMGRPAGGGPATITKIADSASSPRDMGSTVTTNSVNGAREARGIAPHAAGLVRGKLAMASKATPAETPRMAATETRLANQEPSRTIAQIGQATAGRWGKTRKIEGGAGRSDDIPDQSFLTEGLREMRHNYPPGYAIADDNSMPSISKADDSRNEVVFADARRNGIYAPPVKPKRRFEEDYTRGVKADDIDDAENLLVDRHGNPFAPGTMIFGRRTRGGDDVGATHRDFKELSKRLGKPIQIVPRQHIDGKSGTVPFNPKTNKPYGVYLADDLDMKKSRSRHIADHEVMHALDLYTGREQVPSEVLKDMESFYTTLATGKESPPKLTLPADRNYSGPKIRDELVAEAYRAAFKDPNYMKTVAPRTYDWLADRLIRHPRLGIQLNSLAAAAAAALGARGQENDSEAAETSVQSGSPMNPPRGMNSVSRPSIPLEIMDRTKSAGGNGITRLAKALAESRTVPPTEKNGKFRDIARILANLEAKQMPQFYGGAR